MRAAPAARSLARNCARPVADSALNFTDFKKDTPRPEGAGCLINVSVEEVPQLLGAAGVAELAEGLGL